MIIIVSFCTLNMIDLPYGKSTIGCKWIYKIKTVMDQNSQTLYKSKS